MDSEFQLTSIHGRNSIKEKCILSIFGVRSTFYLLPELKKFVAIIGLDLLLQVGAIIDLRQELICTNSGSEPIHFFKCKNVNYTNINMPQPEVPENIRVCFEKVLEKNNGVFADANEALPFNTNVVATIRTTHDDPVYLMHYPYPVGVSDLVNKEIEDMLKSGIIRPSRSPYLDC